MYIHDITYNYKFLTLHLLVFLYIKYTKLWEADWIPVKAKWTNNITNTQIPSHN